MKRVHKSKSERAAGNRSGRRRRAAERMTVNPTQKSRRILSGSTRNVAAGAKLIKRTGGTTRIDVTVVLVRKTKILPAELQQHVLKTPDERPSVDPAAFADEYGASDEAIAAVTSFAAKYGLSVTSVDQGRRVIRLSGSVSNMERAFGTVLHDYEIGEDRYRGRQGPLLLPKEIVAYVEAVLGLDNRPVGKPRLRSRTAQISYYPNDLAALYSFPSGDGTGQTVALIELGGNYGPDDLQIYFAAAGLPGSLPRACRRSSRGRSGPSAACSASDFAPVWLGVSEAATGTFRTSHPHRRMSTMGGKADMTRTGRYVV